jgi:hypothetical protein
MQKSPEIMMMSRLGLDVLNRGRAPARKAYSHWCQALYNNPLPPSPCLRPQFLLLNLLNQHHAWLFPSPFVPSVWALGSGVLAALPNCQFMSSQAMICTRPVYGGLRAPLQKNSSLATVSSILQIPRRPSHRFRIAISHLLGSLPLYSTVTERVVMSDLSLKGAAAYLVRTKCYHDTATSSHRTVSRVSATVLASCVRNFWLTLSRRTLSPAAFR